MSDQHHPNWLRYSFLGYHQKSLQPMPCRWWRHSSTRCFLWSCSAMAWTMSWASATIPTTAMAGPCCGGRWPRRICACESWGSGTYDPTITSLWLEALAVTLCALHGCTEGFSRCGLCCWAYEGYNFHAGLALICFDSGRLWKSCI